MNRQTVQKSSDRLRSARIYEVDIEGTIGVPEQEQFDTFNPNRISTYERFAAVVAQIEAEGGADRLVINIRSLGGDVGEALSIYHAARQLPMEVVTRCWGYVASAATVVAQAASPLCREVAANSLYLIHCCQSTCEGNHLVVGATKELLDKSDLQLAELYAQRAEGHSDTFLELMNAAGGSGRWLSPEEVVSLGLADRIIASEPIVASAVDSLAALGLPPLPAQRHASSFRHSYGTLRQRLGALLLRMGLKDEASEAEALAQPSVAESAVVRSERPSRLHSARPTAVEPCEDPSPTGAPSPKTPNQLAYEQDARSLMSNV